MRAMGMKLTAAILLLFVAGSCLSTAYGDTADSDEIETIVFISLVSDPNENPQSVDMALKLAGFALEEGKEVAIFFNVKGVTLPTSDFPADFAWQENDPLVTQLASLIEQGATVYVCPLCMQSLGVEESDLIEGAHVADKPGLFKVVGPHTAVFTY